ncbi:hypothetical protein AHMF7605_11940 [Adhaeribacter arboris]|uniref:Uncharacterized protein n=1 Tax=Adhaeribacter arboris TaxID=2072846 RepID=A0A2T2YFA5_9BACT|nr:hypothetical protein [Adhaeribacter arboris]PSR54182.1 hypothetical protein AHMF7605_11940 [Adhaeribacter arboris]
MNREFLDTIYLYFSNAEKQINNLEEMIARTKKESSEAAVLKAELYCKQTERQRLDNLINLYCESFSK